MLKQVQKVDKQRTCAFKLTKQQFHFTHRVSRPQLLAVRRAEMIELRIEHAFVVVSHRVQMEAVDDQVAAQQEPFEPILPF